MNTHNGEVVERTIRRNGYSISELARVLNVNRRTIYNWFLQRNLKPEIIYRIGCALRHDFSGEFPHYFSSEDFRSLNQTKQLPGELASREGEEESPQQISHWKNKYITLLEEYNNMLINQMERMNPAFARDLQV